MKSGTVASSSVVISARGVWAEEHLGRAAASMQKMTNSSRLPVLVCEARDDRAHVGVLGEAQLTLALVSDPLSRTLFPESGQIPFEGPQGLLSQIGLLLPQSQHPSFPSSAANPDRKSQISNSTKEASLNTSISTAQLSTKVGSDGSVDQSKVRAETRRIA